MKRTNDDVVGRPRLRELRRDVAGISMPSPVAEVASFRHALDDPMGTASEDADLLLDFAEFMSGAIEPRDGAVLSPDPAFRERLRRKLWRTHVLAHLRDGGETH